MCRTGRPPGVSCNRPWPGGEERRTGGGTAWLARTIYVIKRRARCQWPRCAPALAATPAPNRLPPRRLPRRRLGLDPHPVERSPHEKQRQQEEDRGQDVGRGGPPVGRQRNRQLHREQ